MNEVQEALKRLKKATREGLRKGTRAGAKVVLLKAKALAPKRSGGMVRTIKVRALPRSRKYVGAMARLVNEGSVYYGGFVNYGSKRQPAQRFLNRAADETRSPATNEAIRVLSSVLNGAT